MIEFLTLFLGLLAGEQKIAVSVGAEVARVEIQLDGRPLGSIAGPPWTLIGDFGDELLPHELVAIALGAAGQELGRVEQRINLPRARAEANLTLVQGAGKTPASARLNWQAMEHDRPQRVQLFFDGSPLPASDWQNIELPAHDPKSLHLLRAELVFAENVQAHAELVFGGTFGDTVSSDLTAIAVERTGKNTPKPAEMTGWFTRRGQPLRVVAVHREPIDLIVVREKSELLFEALQKLRKVQLGGQRATLLQGRVPLPWTFAEHDWVRFAFPSPQAQDHSALSFSLFPLSENLASYSQRSIFGILTTLRFPDYDQVTAAQPLADAVAIAAVTAAGTDRRRAVLLVRSGETTDSSQFDPATVRAYLQSLRVPFFHWPLRIGGQGEMGPSAWGKEAPIRDLAAVKTAISNLYRVLDAQLVVWLAGSHLPNEVELAPNVTEIAFPRGLP